MSASNLAELCTYMFNTVILAFATVESGNSDYLYLAPRCILQPLQLYYVTTD